ncbi:hypothetical protein QFZ60_001559 [Arthrobacter sp. B2I5]|uniref:hypothetical protein n=1 Tax=Arthrobacter sp. B2I5 TaxID=3042266 RepID=UPI0027843F64|nr:hypothetical protein [Arthrobacter sp. B2I5]MDQ0825386.1 hypothetical protein [Arthrobacter sp. B2I5]
MSLTKEAYWKNRQEGKRGQGELERAKFTESQTGHFIQLGTRLMPANRGAARRKVVDHKFTTKGIRSTNPEQSAAIRERVKRTESGEQARVAAKKAQATENN